MVQLCYEIKADLATLVPERREELTTEGELDAVLATRADQRRSGEDVARWRDREAIASSSTPMSIRCAPPIESMPSASSCAPHRALLRRPDPRRSQQGAGPHHRRRCQGGAKLGMGVAAGHGLSLCQCQRGGGDRGDRRAQHRPFHLSRAPCWSVSIARCATCSRSCRPPGHDCRPGAGCRRGGPHRPAAGGSASPSACWFTAFSARPSAPTATIIQPPGSLHYAGRFAAKEALVKALAAAVGFDLAGHGGHQRWPPALSHPGALRRGLARAMHRRGSPFALRMMAGWRSRP